MPFTQALSQVLTVFTVGNAPFFDIQQILEEPVAIGTWVLAIAAIALVIVGIYYGRSRGKAQREMIKQQKYLVQEQKNTTEVQKLTSESIQKSVRLQEKTMLMGEMIKIDEMINSESARSDRNAIYNHVSGVELQGNFHIVAERVSSRFDRIGAIIEINDELRAAYLHIHARETGKSWIALNDYVSAERKRKRDQLYYRFFSTIGQKSVEYWNARNPSDSFAIAKYQRENTSNMYSP